MKNFSNRKNFASHMDEELLEEVKKKKNLFKKLQKKRTTRNWMQYKHQRIKVKKLSERKKKIYVCKQVENAKNSEDLQADPRLGKKRKNQENESWWWANWREKGNR